MATNYIWDVEYRKRNRIQKRNKQMYERKRIIKQNAINYSEKHSLPLVQTMLKKIGYQNAFIDKSNKYECTITIKPNCKLAGKLYYGTPDIQIRVLREWLYNQLKKRRMKGVFVYEFHENLNIHLHGIINMINIKENYEIHFARLKNTINRVVGRSSITPIKNIDKYLTYIIKDMHKSGLPMVILDPENNYNRSYTMTDWECASEGDAERIHDAQGDP